MEHRRFRHRLALTAWTLALALTPAAAEPAAATASPTPAAPADSPAVQEVKEFYAPKPLGYLPPGWKLAPLKEGRIQSPPIDLAPGIRPRITVTPYQLAPDDAKGFIEFHDPGFDPALGNKQNATFGAVLTRYQGGLRQLDAQLTALQTQGPKLTGPAEDQLAALLQAVDEQLKGATPTTTPGAAAAARAAAAKRPPRPAHRKKPDPNPEPIAQPIPPPKKKGLFGFLRSAKPSPPNPQAPTGLSR
jgi:hypothetical protein